MSTLRLSKTLDEVRTMVFGHIEDVQEEYIAKGWIPRRLNLNKGVVRGLLEVVCWGLYQLYQFLASVFIQAAPKNCTDEQWMEWHCEQVEAPRKLATKAEGLVVFSRSGTSGNLPIKAGRIVRTDPDGAGDIYRYVTSEDTVIAAGQSEVAVPVVAEEYGAKANATTGQIIEMVTPVTGIEAVTNEADWLTREGTDLETIDQMKERYQVRWLGNNGVSKYAYKSWALSVTGCVAATILDQHPRGQGTVDVIVKGAAGIPTTSLLDDVRAAVNRGAMPDDTEPGTPINDDWDVRAPTAVPITINAELVLIPGTHEETVKQETTKRIQALFKDPSTVSGVSPLQIGVDVPRDLLISVIKPVLGVKKINWTLPTEDVAVGTDGLATLQSLNLTAAEATEE